VFLQNVGIYLQVYTAVVPERPISTRMIVFNELVRMWKEAIVPSFSVQSQVRKTQTKKVRNKKRRAEERKNLHTDH
jgi:hypothetical protein